MQLTAARTYYVLTTGSDSNTGLVNTAGGAFLTIQKAIDTASALDNGGFSITIQIGNGTYTGANTLKTFIGSGSIIIVGDETTPSNCVVSITSGNCFSATGVIGTYTIRGMRLKTITSGHGIAVDSSYVEFQNIDFNAIASSSIFCQNNGYVKGTGNYNITGGGQYHMNVYKGTIISQGHTVTLTGTPAFSQSFIIDFVLGLIALNSTTWTGSATGTRYNINGNSVVDTGGQTTTWLPGNAVGSTATGGQYI